MSSKKPTTGAPSRPSAWDRVRPAAFADSRFHPYRIAAVAAGLAVAVSGATYLGNKDASSSPRAVPSTPVVMSSAPAPSPTGNPIETWRKEVLTDLSSLSGAALNYQQVLQSWEKGKAEDAVLKGTFDVGVTNFTVARDAIDRRAPLTGVPATERALADYRSASHLYLESARVGRAALTLPAGPLREQLRRQVSRLRILGDRVYDQGQREVQALLPALPEDPNIELVKAPEVPDFPFGGLAVGAPLEAGPAASKPKSQRGFVEDKAQQPFADWAADVTRLTPTAPDLAEAITDADEGRLREVSRRFTAAADELYTTPDPTDGRAASTRVQLGILVGAEAGRAGQACALTTAATRTQLCLSAQRLALVGDALWDERLPRRDSGFPESLLKDS